MPEPTVEETRRAPSDLQPREDGIDLQPILGLNARFESFVHHSIVVAIGVWILATVIAVGWYIYNYPQYFTRVYFKHAAATIAIPLATLLSASLVVLFRHVGGPIELDAFGIKFKGAAAPIVFWLLIFAVHIFALTQCWNLQN
ncbi:hypothetical protein [Gloeobacter violaceus]|uniref:hypothetical protein n=1 Tax=Gloeobacter violaceus TaxID=33072 RepID=UPI0013E8B8B6|nr:hypothetical protein [Gloeobacter violaceus]